MKKERVNLGFCKGVLWGEESDAVILGVPGAGSHKEDVPLELLAQVATERGYQVLSFDLPGQGERKTEEFCTPQTGAREVEQVLSYVKNRWSSCSFFGCSMGACYGLLGSQRESFSKILLLSPVLHMERLILSMAKEAEISEAELKEKQEVTLPSGRKLFWEEVEYTRKQEENIYRSGVSILWGEDDALIPREEIEEYGKETGAHLTIIPEAGHYFHTSREVLAMKTWLEERLEPVHPEYESCHLCPRACQSNRARGMLGVCHTGDKIIVARGALHEWEEPCISGKEGSGAVFFGGCTLGCIYCQNREISQGKLGKELSVSELKDLFLKLQEKKAANINLVTPDHQWPRIEEALHLAKRQGLSLPILCNCSGYETEEWVERAATLVDIFLPDFKYGVNALGEQFSQVKNYREVALQAIGAMIRAKGHLQWNKEGMAESGVMVRHLILPGHTKESMEAISVLLSTFGSDLWISIMNQYTPMGDLPYPELNRKLTKREYEKVIRKALEEGMEHGYYQEGDTAEKSFIPPFHVTEE